MDRVEGNRVSVDENILNRRKLEPESGPERKSIDHCVTARVSEGIGDRGRVERMLVVIRDPPRKGKEIPTVENRIDFLRRLMITEDKPGGVEAAPHRESVGSVSGREGLHPSHLNAFAHRVGPGRERSEGVIPGDVARRAPRDGSRKMEHPSLNRGFTAVFDAVPIHVTELRTGDASVSVVSEIASDNAVSGREHNRVRSPGGPGPVPWNLHSLGDGVRTESKVGETVPSGAVRES